MLDWLFESATFSLAGGALGVTCCLLTQFMAVSSMSCSGASDALVMFQPMVSGEATPIALAAALGGGMIGAFTALMPGCRKRRRGPKVPS